MEENYALTCKAIERFCSPGSLAVLALLMPPPNNDVSRVQVLLHELIRNYMRPHGLTIAVAKVLRKQGYSVYLWEHDGLPLALAKSDFRNLNPALLFLVTKLIARLLAWRRDAKRGRGRSSGDTAAVGDTRGGGSCEDARSAKVLYFPHKGPNYGDLLARESVLR